MQTFEIFDIRYFNILSINEVKSDTERANKRIHIIEPNIPNHCKQEVLNIILEFQDIFALKEDKMTVNNFYEQALKTSPQKPTYIKNYRTPFGQKAEIDRQIQNLIDNNLIEPS